MEVKNEIGKTEHLYTGFKPVLGYPKTKDDCRKDVRHRSLQKPNTSHQ